jgi:glycosyltransferase involved in cell wall biosynthesis
LQRKATLTRSTDTPGTSARVHSLLLVRNGVDHDARVLRAAHVAERKLGGSTLIVGVATVASPAGRSTVEGVEVLRLRAGMRRSPAAPGGRPDKLPRRPAAVSTARNSGMAPAGAVKRDTSRERARIPQRPSQSAARIGPNARARRILSGLSFALRALMVARRVRPKLVHANDWNTMWSGMAIKLVCGARLVYDSHELWADRNGRWESRLWLLASEALFVRVADEVLASSPGHATAIAARYRVTRPTIVRNIPETRPAAASSPIARRGTASNACQAPLVAYVGGLMPGRGLEQAIDAVALLPDVRLRTIGTGSATYRASLMARAAALEIADRVELCAPVRPGDVTGALAGAAVGLCLIQPICRSYELCLPNKLFEYAAAGLPILASDVPVIASVVRDEGLGVVVVADRPDSVATGLEHLLSPDRWRPAAERVKAFADTHDWPAEASTLAGVYARAARRGGV